MSVSYCTELNLMVYVAGYLVVGTLAWHYQATPPPPPPTVLSVRGRVHV